MKKFPHFGRMAVHTFGMPLHADSKRMILYLDCLDCIILRACADNYILSGRVDGLMVKTVYKKTGTDILSEAASAFGADPVADLAAGCGLLHMIKRFSGNERHVLPDCTSAGDAQDLHSPADSKDGFAGFQYTLHKTNLK